MCVCVCVRKRERVKSERVKGILVNYTPVSVMSGQKTIKLQSFVFFTFGFIFLCIRSYAKLRVRREPKNAVNKNEYIWQCITIMHEMKT